MLKLIYLFLLIVLFLPVSFAQTYLSQDFEAAFTGSPEAPPGWTQSRVVLLGDGVPDGIAATSGEKDWQKNTNTGTATWSLTPGTFGTVPNSAVSGTGVAWLQNRDFGGSGSNYGSRRLESSSIDLSSSSSPYVRFWLFWNDASTVTSMNVVASSDNGTTWKVLMTIPPNFTQTAVTSATPWERISVKIPAAFKTSNMKVGIQVTSTWTSNNIFIDDLTVSEFTPTVITSIASGNWNSTLTWSTGTIPSSDNDVVISAGHVVVSNVFIARMQNLTVSGTLNYSSTTTSLLNHIFGNLTVDLGGVYTSFFSTTGKRTYLGGNLTNNGTMDFGISATSTSEAALVWLGYGDAVYSGSGSFNFSKINTVWHNKEGSVTYNSPVTITFRSVLGYGTVNPNGNLTLGNSSSNITMTIEKHKGSFGSSPIFGSGVTRSVSYLDGAGVAATLASQVAPCNVVSSTPGFEIEDISGTRTVAGTLLINTYGTVPLAFPVTVGTAAAGTLTLTRGIVITTNTNLLTLNQGVTGAAGTVPSIVTPPTTHGSYISGPLKILMPASGTTARNFGLGEGTSIVSSTPNSNALRTVTLTPGATGWASQIITATIEGAPSGTANAPLTATMGPRSYRLNMNGGPELPNTATVGITGRNSTFGGGDLMLGQQQELRVAQSTSLSGPWTERSVTTGTGAFLDNTNYTRTTTATVSPLATNGEYFALATTTTGMTYSTSITTQNSNLVYRNNTNQQVIGIQVTMNGAIAPLSVTGINLNATGSSSLSDISNAKVFYTGSSSTFATTTQFGSAFGSPTLSDFTISGSQTLTSGINYFWLTYDVVAGATVGNVIDGQCTGVTISGGVGTVVPTETNPVGSRNIQDVNYGGNLVGNGGYYFANSLATTAPSYPVYSWIDPVAGGHSFITTWTSGGSGDDDYFTIPDLGFDFSYFGTTFRTNNVYIGSNGYITFGTSSTTGAGTKTIPSLGVPHNVVGGCMMDLDPRVVNYPNAKIYYGGDATKFVITYWHVYDYVSSPPSPDYITFQIILFADGNIEIQYNDAETVTPFASSQFYTDGVVGIENVDGTLGVGYRNDGVGGSMISSPMAVMFGTNQAALPVELSSFTAIGKGRDINLNWETKTEINSSKFIIERSSVNDLWSSVGTINAAGNSNTPKQYSFSDCKLNSGKYNYRLKIVDFDGSVKYSAVVEGNIELPKTYQLSQNYPNPFNPSTRIDYQLPMDARVTIELYSITGEMVAELFNNEQSAGYYTLDVNSSSLHKNLASGVYIYRMVAFDKTNGNNFVNVKKMMMLK